MEKVFQKLRFIQKFNRPLCSPCCDDGMVADGPPNAEFEFPNATPFGFVELGGGGRAAAATAAIAAA